MLPYPILPCHPVCWEAESHGHFWRAIPAEWAWDHCLLVSFPVLIIWYSSKFCPSITGLLVVFSVCSPQVGGAGRNQGKDRSMEFSLWVLSQCRLGRTNMDFSARAGSPPCSAIILYCGQLLFSEQTKPLCSGFLVNYREMTLSLQQCMIDQVFPSVPAGCWAVGMAVQLPGLALHMGLPPLGAAADWAASLQAHQQPCAPHLKVIQPKPFSCVVCTVLVFGGPCSLSWGGETLGLVLGWRIFHPLRNSIFLGDVSAFLWCDWMMGRDIPQQWLGSSCGSCVWQGLNSGLHTDDDDELSSLWFYCCCCRS